MSTKVRARKKAPEEEQLPEKERLRLIRMVNDFLATGMPELTMPGLCNQHRKFLHHYAAQVNLKSKSYGKAKNRTLHIMRTKANESFGSPRVYEITPNMRQVLIDALPSLKASGDNVSYLQPAQSQSQGRRMRSEVLSLQLGPRMVPPPPNPIRNSLRADKQNLPITRYADEIQKMLRDHQVFIINGETGSGKTTQVPQYILNDATLNQRPCRIIVTQPRRVAATSIAARVAEERGEPLGEAVGYQIRMESRVKKTTNLIYTTSGCLLRTIMGDMKDLFSKVSHLIIDEIHERDKNTDFTLISIKEHLQKNRELRVILMSATMDIPTLSGYFNNCPVLNVPGQGHEITVYHLEDILYHTGYHTDLMDKYLRSMDMNGTLPLSPVQPVTNHNNDTNTEPVLLQDERMQYAIDQLLNQCLDAGRTDEEIAECFDQIQYFIESEDVPADVGHSKAGTTPLMVACKINMPRYVDNFLRLNANLRIRDMMGFSAFEYAALHNDGIITNVLETHITSARIQHTCNAEDIHKQRLLSAYQQQFREDSDVDHNLILSLLEGIYRSKHPGAVMVFLPGYNDIVQQRELITSTFPHNSYRVCVLHGQMDTNDQAEALRYLPVRKFILSTNIGQTSITVPDLAYIIDAGKIKMKAYDCITESSQLQAVWISQADALQRSGRAGRTQNGVCYRLYSQAKFDYLAKFAPPEFVRIPLTEICLYAKTLDPHTEVQNYLLRALNPPTVMSVQNAIKKLQILEVFNADESVTEMGRHLVELPLDVQLGKCLLYAVFLKCVDPVLTIVAFHSVKDPFIIPSDRTAQGQASKMRKNFAGKSFSDQMGILRLYKGYLGVRGQKKKAREFCSRFYLSQSSMEMFCATRRQLLDCLSHQFRIANATANNDDMNMVRFCLTAGFYPNIAVVDYAKNTLCSGTEKQLMVQRTSALNPPGKKHLKEYIKELPYDWIIFFEKSRLGKMYAINFNTVVSPVMVILQSGHDFYLEDEVPSGASTEGESSDDPDDLERTIIKTVKNLKIGENHRSYVSVDSWIKFQMTSADAMLLTLLRTALKKQFILFVTHGSSPQTNEIVRCLKNLLHCLHSNIDDKYYVHH